jgi:hypothetical protein
MHNLQGNTLFIPLFVRIFASKKFPEYFFYEKALSPEQFIPAAQKLVRILLFGFRCQILKS